MSFRRTLLGLGVALCLAAPAAVHAQGDYLDVFIVKVKPEKVADFQALTKKWADANRRFNGDHWLAMETVYGEGNVYQFTSIRKDYGEIDKMNDAAEAAAQKAFGKETAKKMEQDFDNCLVWSRTELRRRRWDLSRKAPTDAESYAKLIGDSRVLRTVAVHVKSGHIMEFEALLREAKEAAEKNPNTQPLFVSQAVEGNKGTIFYVTSLRSSLGGFDHNQSIRDILGEEGYKKFLQVNSDAVETADATLLRFSPEISNPPDDVAKVATDFWHPKAITAANTKPKAAGAALEPAAQKEKEPSKKPN